MLLKPTRIRIDGELYNVSNVYDGGYLPMIETEEGCDFYLAEDSEKAGEAARKYWEDMANDDPSEFRAIIGDEALVAWALGQPYAPGSVSVNSLNEWLDLVATVPEEEFAGYDSQEREVNRCGILANELGFMPTVAYRHN